MAFTYDDKDQRININGSRTSRTADTNLLQNLRFKFKDLLDGYTDEQIVDSYDTYALSEDWGDEMLWFNNWLVDWK